MQKPPAPWYVLGMGYLLVLLFGAVLVVIFVVGLAQSGNKLDNGMENARLQGMRGNPSADEPTPGRSVIASQRQQENARRQTPSA